MVSRTSLQTGFLSVALALPLIASAALSDEEERAIEEDYRECRARAEEVYFDAFLPAYQEYHDQYESHLERQRDDTLQAWEIEDNGDRGRAIRDADQNFARENRDSKEQLNDRLREARQQRSEARSECSKQRSDAQRDQRNDDDDEDDGGNDDDDDRDGDLGDICLSNNECNSGLYCTVTTGECRSPCRESDPFCVQVCAGVCARSNSSSSRSSSSRSSYWSSSRSSSRSSSSSPNMGYNCNPFICNDGTQHPACTESGHPIYYFVDPCYTHGGQRP